MLKVYKFLLLWAVALLAACGGGGGLPGTQSGDAQLRVYPPINAVTVPVGVGAASVEIRGGDRPYAVFSNHPAISATLVDGNIMRIRALAPIDNTGGSGATAGGSTPKVWFTDKNGIKTVEIQVSTFSIPLNNTVPASIVMTVAETRSGVVSGGTAPYVYTSANNGVATITGNANGQYTINAVATGTTRLQIADASGSRLELSVEVRDLPVGEFQVTPSAGSGRVGSTLLFDVKGGRKPYTVLSNNASIATAQLVGRVDGVTPDSNGDVLRVRLERVGNTTVVVRDATGATREVQIGSTDSSLINTLPGSIVMVTSETRTGAVTGGTAPYVYSSTNNNVATISGTAAGQYTITAAAPGIANLRITDALGSFTDVQVQVRTSSAVDMVISPASGTGRVGSTLVFDVSGGTRPYTVLSNNSNIASATINDRTVSVRLNLVGSTTVVVRDNLGITKEIAVTSTPIVQAPLIITPPLREVSERSTADVVFTLGDGVPPFIPIVRLQDQALVSATISADNTQLILRPGTAGNRCISTAVQDVVVDVFDQTGVAKSATLRIRDEGTCP